MSEIKKQKPDREKVRLQKYIADCGFSSRRAAEKRIETGHVTVDGKIAHVGDSIIPGSVIVEIDGRRIAQSAEHKYIMLNKPRGVVTTMSDERGRRTVADLVADCPGRLYPVGRLDYNSEGLLIMTNDGELANRMMHPSGKLPKYYRVKYSRPPTDRELEILMAPHVIDGYKIKPITLSVVGESGDTVEMELHEGRNREIRKVSERAGLLIKRLRRVAIGKIILGDLAPGKWRYLRSEEVKYLKRQLSDPDKR